MMIVNKGNIKTKSKREAMMLLDTEIALFNITQNNELDFIKNTVVSSMYNKVLSYIDINNPDLIVNLSNDKPKSKYNKFTSKNSIKKLLINTDKRFIIDNAKNEEDEEFVKYLEDLYKDNERANRNHFDDECNYKQYRKIKNAYRNRKPLNLKVLGKFYKDKDKYIIDIYYRNFKKDHNLITNIKATFVHELFHFIHCLCLENKGYNWNDSISCDVNGENKVYITDIILEGFAEKFELDYLKTIDFNIFYDIYKNLSSYSIFSYPYSAAIMLDKIDATSTSQYVIKDIFDDSIYSFVYSFSDLINIYKNEFLRKKNDDFMFDILN